MAELADPGGTMYHNRVVTLPEAELREMEASMREMQGALERARLLASSSGLTGVTARYILTGEVDGT